LYSYCIGNEVSRKLPWPAWKLNGVTGESRFSLPCRRKKLSLLEEFTVAYKWYRGKNYRSYHTNIVMQNAERVDW